VLSAGLLKLERSLASVRCLHWLMAKDCQFALVERAS